MTVAASPAPATSFVRRHRGKLLLLTVLVVGLGGVSLWTLATLTFSYSTGDRIGYVQKLSRKGWLCRTWEGELAMSPVPGSAPQIFPFTIPDDAVATKLKDVEGKRVAIHYEEKRGVPSSCFGDTSYFVTDIRVVPQ